MLPILSLYCSHRVVPVDPFFATSLSPHICTAVPSVRRAIEMSVRDVVVTCLWRWHKLWNQQRNHTFQWRSTILVPKRQRGRPATHCWPSPGSPEYTVGCPGCDGRSYRHLLKCQQKRVELGLTASCSLRDVRGDVVMEEAPPPPPPAEPPPVLRTSEETDAMTLAAVHPYGHEEPLEISQAECESFVRGVFYVEEDTLEELPLDEVVEGVNRELDRMKSFPVYQAVPRAEVTCKVWSTRWCKFSGCKFLQSHSCARGHESVVSDGSVERPHHFVR